PPGPSAGATAGTAGHRASTVLAAWSRTRLSGAPLLLPSGNAAWETPVTDATPQPAPPEATAPAAAGLGTVVAVRGSVVDARFPGGPPALRELVVGTDDEDLRLEVRAHLDAATVRCLAFGSTDGVARGDRKSTRLNSSH